MCRIFLYNNIEYSCPLFDSKVRTVMLQALHDITRGIYTDINTCERYQLIQTTYALKHQILRTPFSEKPRLRARRENLRRREGVSLLRRSIDAANRRRIFRDFVSLPLNKIINDSAARSSVLARSSVAIAPTNINCQTATCYMHQDTCAHTIYVHAPR